MGKPESLIGFENTYDRNLPRLRGVHRTFVFSFPQTGYVSRAKFNVLLRYSYNLESAIPAEMTSNFSSYLASSGTTAGPVSNEAGPIRRAMDEIYLRAQAELLPRRHELQRLGERLSDLNETEGAESDEFFAAEHEFVQLRSALNQRENQLAHAMPFRRSDNIQFIHEQVCSQPEVAALFTPPVLMSDLAATVADERRTFSLRGLSAAVDEIDQEVGVFKPTLVVKQLGTPGWWLITTKEGAFGLILDTTSGTDERSAQGYILDRRTSLTVAYLQLKTLREKSAHSKYSDTPSLTIYETEADSTFTDIFRSGFAKETPKNDMLNHVGIARLLEAGMNWPTFMEQLTKGDRYFDLHTIMMLRHLLTDA